MASEPVIEALGETPTFPSMVVAPVLLTAVAARTAKPARFDPSKGVAHHAVGTFVSARTTKTVRHRTVRKRGAVFALMVGASTSKVECHPSPRRGATLPTESTHPP